METPGLPAVASPPAPLDEKRRRLLALLLKEQGVDPLRAPILPLPRDGRPLPLSFGQERLWLIDQIEPGNVAYNTASALRLRGRLDPALLGRTLSEIVRRHEVLRTTFAAGAEGPIQVIAPAAPVPLPLVDLHGLLPEAREAGASRLAAEEAWRPFDLTRGPMLRMCLLRLSEDEHALLLTVHHITSDGWSTGILVREVMALYADFSAGLPSPLPELPIQYADFAAWQRTALGGATLERELAYWRGQLEGSGVLELPTDHPRPVEPSLAAGLVHREIPAAPAAPLKALARAGGATLFMLLAAAWAALLSRWSGAEDLNLGTPIANRRRSETEGLVGFFVNTLVIRIDLAGDPTFRELLARVRQVALEAFEHQDLPFSRIVEELRPERSLVQNPLFQVLFGMGNAPGTELEIPGLSIGALAGPRRAAMFDLNLSAHEEQGLGFELEYRADLFEPATARRLLDDLATLLGGVAADPDRRLSDLPVLAPPERHALLVEWNDTAMAPPGDLVRALAERAARDGEAVALVGETERGETLALTYRELHARAAHLAGRLLQAGAGRGTRVALAGGRSPAVMVGLVAILRAGAAYVPLDPAYPRDRLRRVLADAGAAALLAERRLLPGLPPFDGPLVPLDPPPPRAAAAEPAREPGPAAPQDLAYVLYTSGSTGQPKGVAMTRGALAHLLAWQGREVLPGAARTLQFASLSFDVSAQEIGSAWLAGGALVLVSEETRRDPRALLAYLARQEVERLYLPFVALRGLAEAAAEGGAATPALADVVAAGEALQVTPAVAAWLGATGARLHNQYGPTETHVATACTLDGDPAGWPPLPPIGRPVGGARVLLLDARLAPVPLGAAGEVCVGGAAPARGYLGRPDATAERFVPDAWSGAPGARLYATGDLARWLPEGRLQFLGRRDDQVKVRGVRVEPGEVEAGLAEHPGVAQAVVVPVEGRAAGMGLELAAFVVPRPGGMPATDELRDLLRARLPESFVPTRWQTLEALPLTPSGKVDRRALALLGGGADGSEPSSASAAPRTATEELLAGLWAELLGRERVGIHDSFFALGGHSLLATQVVSRLRALHGLDLPVRAIFERPTVAGLAEHVDGLLRRERRGPAAPPLASLPRDGRLPLSFAQERLWFIDRLDPGSAVYNLPVALRLRGPLDSAALERALVEIARRHETLRTTIAVEGGAPVQRIAPRPGLGLPRVDLAALPPARREAEARRLAAEEGRRPFDLARGPLARAALLALGTSGRDGREEHVALFTLHHVISDGWSMDVLVREVIALYAAFSAGRPSSLPEPPIQYADFARWQRERLAGEAMDRELAWWAGTLAGVPPLELPADRPRPPLLTARGEVRRGLLLAPPSRDRLAAIAEREGATLFMALLAGWCALLARVCGQADVAVGTPIAGRTRPEVAELIGFFVNTLVLRLDLAGDPPFDELVRRARHTALEAYDHQEVPFERIVAALKPERDRSRTPLFQVMFTLQNAGGDALELPGLEIAPVEVETQAVKFDLGLDVGDGPAGLLATVAVRTDLFFAATGSRLLGHLQALLAGAVADPRARLSALPLLSAAERHQVLLEWGGVGLEQAEAGPEPAPRRLMRVASAVPEAVAVEMDGEALSFGELARRAGRLAGRLRRAGVGREVRVGVLAERTASLAVALLGVWRAGGAYLPLEPSLPAERLAWMIEDGLGEGGVLLAGASLRTRLAELPVGGRPVVWLEEHDAGTAAPGGPMDGEPWSEPETGDVAYLIYTSGSTGRPKAVVVEHGSLAHTLAAAQSAFGFTAGDRMPCLAPFSFDIFLFELLGPLLAGGTARLVAVRPTVDLAALGAALPAMTLLHAVPALMRQVAAIGTRQGGYLGLRQVFVGGDAVGEDLLAALEEAFPRARVSVLYGPTEGTILAAGGAAGPASGLGTPLGRPLPGTALVPCDAAGNPVPAGVAGELRLLGPGLARGYLGRPDLTAAAWLPRELGGGRLAGGAPGERPFEGDAARGSRLYRTGDLARWRPDGRLEFLGRADRQVKVRGFRVEPGEVEAVLASHPGVAEVAVVARRGERGEEWLAAYLAPRPGARLDPAELARHAASRLPAYMVPATWEILAALPLGPHGKVDQGALPLAAEGTGTGGAARGDRAVGAPPAGPAELRVAEAWAEVLGRRPRGVAEGFFEAGGDSIQAALLVNLLQERLGIPLPVGALFDAPTVAGLASTVEQRLEWGGATVASEEEALRPAGWRPGEPLPLSFAQERLWFIDQLDPGTSTYNVPAALRLDGSLDVGALAASLAEIVRRHASLRTTFGIVGGRPAQVVAATAPVPLPQVDLGRLQAERREEEVRRLAAAEADRPFDLARGPLVRATLLRLGPEEHALLFNMHHIVSDGWSVGVLTGELSALYAAFSRGLPSPLPELPLQYADFALWQRRWLAGERLEEQIAFWRETLAGAPPLDLPTDFPRPPVASPHGGSRARRLPAGLRESLARLAEREGATPFMVLLAGLAALLGRTAGQSDVSVGFPIANRTRPELEGLIGFFVNTLVLRVDLAGAPGLRELVGRVRRSSLAAFAHQDLPFEKMVEVLQPERDRSRTPLFQVMFTLQNAPAGEAAELPGLRLSQIDLESEGVKFDLTVSAQELPDGILLGAEFRRELFRPATILRLLGHLEALLAGALADPERPVGAVPILSEAESHQALLGWCDRPRSLPEAATLPGLLARRAAERPEGVAAVAATAATAAGAAGEALTWGELARRVERLALRLMALGVGPEVAVAACLGRTPRWLIALLATLRARGVWVPLDPAYPQERLAGMLDDSRAALLLADPETLDVVPSPRPPTLVLGSVLSGGGGSARRELRRDPSVGDESGRGRPREALPAEPDPLGLAYVIFTSGSTGRPKGVGVPHRGTVPLGMALVDAGGLNPADRVLQFSSPGFDASIFEVAAALTSGAALHFASREELLPGPPLAGLVGEAGITTGLLPPSALGAMEPQDLPSLRAPFVGGEACPAERADAWAVGRLFVDAYGPTETTVCVTFGEHRPGDRPVSLGRPIAGAALYVVDEGFTPQPAGVPGELLVGGDPVTRGYLGRPDLTAASFVPDPFGAGAPGARFDLGGAPGARLYRTGDLVRWLPDGHLEFLGRIDRQVKVRGFRIEPGEIEGALLRHPAVREAAVLAWAEGDDPSLRRLAAYLAVDPERRPGVEELRAFLAPLLPEHMVPSAWIFLEALPTTPSGKIDRRALPAPDRDRPDLAGGYVAPRTDLERAMAEVWQEALGLDRVGVEDNFFDLGGTSLQGALLVNLLRERMAVDLPVAALFEAPTVAGLARLAGERAGRAAEGAAVSSSGPLVPLRTGGQERPVFWVHPVGGNVLCYADLARRLEPGRPVYGLQAVGLDGGEPQPRIEEMAASYLDAVAAVQPAGPYLLGGWSLGGVVAYEMARQLARRGERVDLLALIDSPVPGTIELPPADDAEVLAALVGDLAGQAGQDFAADSEDLRRAAPTERVDLVLRRAAEAGILPPGVGAEGVGRLLRVFAANREAAGRYTPGSRPELPVPALLFRAADRPGPDPEPGWRDLLGSALEAEALPGDHYALLREPAVSRLAASLRRRLARLART